MKLKQFSIINLTDSYKFSHFNQYPKDIEVIHSYMVSRGGKYEKMIFFGLRYYLSYLKKPITLKDIKESKKLAEIHGIPFNEIGWKYILKKHKGKLPLLIKSIEEGSIFKKNQPILTIENTDSKCFWLTSYVETLLLKLWYPITVATKSYYAKKLLIKHWKKTSENLKNLEFAYHNFGDRGASTSESAALGGLAHLTQFKGTDNFNALVFSHNYYDKKYKGFSIPASEHSTVISWGEENEHKMIENYLEKYKNSKYSVISSVLDSFNIYKMVDFVTSGKIKKKIESPLYPIFVIRADSGNPFKVIKKILNIMFKNKVNYLINKKGYLVFDKYRIIWSDEIELKIIDKILTKFTKYYSIQNMFKKIKLSAENFIFGSGGDLMQKINRDTCKLVVNCSAVKIKGKWKEIFKKPITDKNKKSLKGKQDCKLKAVFKN